jgi:hypothetical protein
LRFAILQIDRHDNYKPPSSFTCINSSNDICRSPFLSICSTTCSLILSISSILQKKDAHK